MRRCSRIHQIGRRRGPVVLPVVSGSRPSDNVLKQSACGDPQIPTDGAHGRRNTWTTISPIGPSTTPIPMWV